MSKKSEKLPSRAKYDLSHPTVSIRVNRELYDQLEALRLVSGKSLGDILREAVDKQAPSTLKAYDDGYDDAKRKFAITYKCSICGGNIILSSPKEKEAAMQYMRDHRWGHGECQKKRQTS